MTRRNYLDKDELEILRWSLLPREEQEQNPLSPKRRERYERANVADNLIREHFSLRKVIERLVDKFGYSESTARRDVSLGQALWGSRNKLSKEYAASMLWDYAVECMIRAGKDRRWNDVARLLREAKEIAGIGKPDIEDPDPDALSNPSQIKPDYLPALVGGTEISNSERQELLQKLLQKKRQEGFIDQSTLAQFVDDEGEPEAD